MLPLDFYSKNRNDASSLLASHLRQGSLVLFLGAGVSQPLGLPAWPELVRRCLVAAGIDPPDSTFETARAMRLAIDPIEADRSYNEYAELVRKSLYEGVRLTDDLVVQRLLIALGALTMSSRRGSVRTVVTLNFDDVLEQYWHIHGYSWQAVTDLPVLLRETDVTIFHPNGFLPSEGAAKSNFIVFSEKSFEKRMSLHQTEWRSLMTDLLLSRVGLFIGLSGEDPLLGPALQDVMSRVQSSRPTGFWMRGPGKTELTSEYFLQRNVVPLSFASFDEYPTFLFDVCQRAASGV